MHVIKGTILYLLYRLPDNENAPFQNDLTTEWKVFKASRYTAQSPLIDGRTLRLLVPDQAEERVSVYRLILTIENIYFFETSYC